MARLPRPLRRLAGIAAVAALAWLGGLGWFVASSLALHGDGGGPTDAIVVLTGGRLRLESAVDLFGAGKARKLFVSGVNHRVDREDLGRVFGPVADRAQCCIVLGHAADNTYENARETARWMREEHFTSLRLVTSWYHMHRSLLEFRRAMPAATILAAPVFPHREEPEPAGAWLAAAGVTVGEYDKLLAAWLRPAMQAVLPLPAADPGDGATAAARRQ